MYARHDFNPSERYGQSSSGGYNMQSTMKKLVIPNRNNVQLNQYNPSTSYHQEQRSNFAGNADRENGQMLNRSFANGSSTSITPGFQKSSYERQYNPSTSYNQEQRPNFTGNVNKENRNFVNGSSTSSAPGFQKTSYDRQYNPSTKYNQEQRSNFTGNVDKENRSFVNGGSTSTAPGFHKTSYEKRDEGTSTNQLGLMGMPKPKANSSSAQSSTASSRKMDNVSQIDNRPKSKMLGESAGEKLFILTGTVERVIKYGKIFQNHFCYFQVLGSVVSVATGKIHCEKTMLLRDKKGPVLQLNYYSNSTHINIEDFHLGQNLRAVGRMVGPNVMSAITIRGASDEEMEILPRLCYISDYAVSTLCGDGQI